MLGLTDKLNLNKSPSLSGIHPRVIKELKAEIVDLLTKTCNLSLLLVSGVEDWKVANITPIFKKGSEGDPGNYRPVRLTSVPRKIIGTAYKR